MRRQRLQNGGRSKFAPTFSGVQKPGRSPCGTNTAPKRLGATSPVQTLARQAPSRRATAGPVQCRHRAECGDATHAFRSGSSLSYPACAFIARDDAIDGRPAHPKWNALHNLPTRTDEKSVVVFRHVTNNLPHNSHVAPAEPRPNALRHELLDHCRNKGLRRFHNSMAQLDRTRDHGAVRQSSARVDPGAAGQPFSSRPGTDRSKFSSAKPIGSSSRDSPRTPGLAIGLPNAAEEASRPLGSISSSARIDASGRLTDAPWSRVGRVAAMLL